ncbi:hypothetical protein JZM24_15535 [Candidatus Sodalis endolongispinus]|uniref:Phage protein n=1 Tax=Candidatus Sodalis endolongispinus TaxID=2812662 RepID=A0ABS5YDS2_9GAMM|nr:hypothetical protein [Candidatus Sodalis endolongispinus]MBT9433175.1 hypothetical protein [Candidatus Sodalis endolongispinus]
MLTGFMFRGVYCGMFNEVKTFKDDDGKMTESKKIYVGLQSQKINKFGIIDSSTQEFLITNDLVQTGFHRKIDSLKGKVLEITFNERSGEYNGMAWARLEILGFEIIEENKNK